MEDIPPNNDDLLTSITAVDFDDAWAGRVEVEVDGQRVGFIGREQLIQNKLATGRVKDLLDVEQLRLKDAGD